MPIPQRFYALRHNRRAMAAEFTIVPIRRFQCLPTRPVAGLYRQCTKEAYQFTGQSMAGGDIFTFYTGHTVGNELLTLLGLALPPLETWEVVAAPPGAVGAAAGGGRGIGGAVAGAVAPPRVHPFNEQLLRLLNLFFLKHDYEPARPSGRVFTEINHNLVTPQYRCARVVNTVLARHTESSTDLVHWLMTQVAGAHVRPYDFRLVHDYLAAVEPLIAQVMVNSPF